jgi:hypothetical protein
MSVAEISASELCEEAITRNPIDDYLRRVHGAELRHGRCACPIHGGDNPTGFSAWKKGGEEWRWKCFTGDCGSGDVLDLEIHFSRIGGRDRKHARVLAAKRLLGIDDASADGEAISIAPAKVRANELDGVKARHRPEFERITKDDIRAISELRSIDKRPLFIAARRRLLRIADVYGHRCGVVTDGTGECYLARRLDGKSWTDKPGDKTRIMSGGNGAWPIGVREAKGFPCIALCEGWGDFLAAFGHAWASGVEGLVAPVCMTSSSVSIDSRALQCFDGKHICIYCHNDEKGRRATERWIKQIHERGSYASIDVYTFDFGARQMNGRPIGDLNDLLRVDADSWEKYRERIESVMNFATENFQ